MEADLEPDALDSVDFYNLMQNYRLASMYDQQAVVERFEAIKSYIRQHVTEIRGEPHED